MSTPSNLNRYTMIITVAVALAGFRVFAHAQAVTLSTVADSTLAVPGGTGAFQTFNPNLAGYPPNPCISDGNVAFCAGGRAGSRAFTLCLRRTPISFGRRLPT